MLSKLLYQKVTHTHRHTLFYSMFHTNKNRSKKNIHEFFCLSAETPEVSVSVWPPGSNIYPGECMLLRCSVASGSRSVWTYRWFRNKPHTALTPNPRHLASHDSYSITGVTREDGGSYWCQAERRGRNSTTVLLSDPARLTVSGELRDWPQALQRAVGFLLQHMHSKTHKDEVTSQM